MSLSPQVRVLAAAGFAAMLALMGGYMVLARGQSASRAAVPVIKPLHPVKHHVVVKAAPKKAVAHKAAAAKPLAEKVVPKKVAAKPVVVKTAVRPAPTAKPKAAPKVHVPAVIDGMPSALALALHPVKHVVVKAAPKKAVAHKAAAAKPLAKKVVPKKVAAKPVVAKTPVRPAQTAKPKAAPKVHVPAVIDGMPSALALALRAHKVVVVSLFTPGASVDAMATAEAKRGAATARAGFVAFNVANEKIVSPLTSLMTGAPTPADRVLDGPAVLVFVRPNTLFVRLNGFADGDTVAQAAANAATLAQ